METLRRLPPHHPDIPRLMGDLGARMNAQSFSFSQRCGEARAREPAERVLVLCSGYVQ
jgi:hypothetical protein